MEIQAYVRQATAMTSQQKWQKVSLNLDSLCDRAGSTDAEERQWHCMTYNNTQCMTRFIRKLLLYIILRDVSFTIDFDISIPFYRSLIHLLGFDGFAFVLVKIAKVG
jgi:hypothetical protein